MSLDTYDCLINCVDSYDSLVPSLLYRKEIFYYGNEDRSSYLRWS